MGTLRALVLRAPGINCDRETAHACRQVGFETDLVHINQLARQPESLLDYHFLAIPGGFSYGDDLGAGTLLAQNLKLHLGDQLRRFVAEGRPVLGICNGFQVLVRLGLLPVASEDAARNATLTENESAHFECRWINLSACKSPCIFTRGIERPIELPVAHGEGQFVFTGDLAHLQANGQIPLVYSDGSNHNDAQPVAYPANPNGSKGDIAGVCNERGNVFGLMPHPERYIQTLQHPLHRGMSNDQGDGLLIFQNAYQYAQSLFNENGENGTRQASSNTNGHAQQTASQQSPLSYAASGVNIDAGEQAVRLMREAVRTSQGPEVLAGVGAFAGVFKASALQKMRHPALVASTDGVGTKTLLATQAGRYDTIGYDIVNHSVNDLLAQGARPLFFMDYLAVNKLDPIQAATIVQGVANACKEANCALLGGETAEMPDVYAENAFDLAGTIVGVVEEEDAQNGATISEGDTILGLPSSGLHTNGYSLARRIFASYALETVFPELGESLADALLRPHRCYLPEVTRLREYLSDRGRYIKGIAHITGGGFKGNISRILPVGTQAVIDTTSWQVPPLFQLIARLSGIEQEELYRTFNMGIGMIIVLGPKAALEARSALPELQTIGKITRGEGVVLV
ncbi:phosphoribosylformylglycinamidine cyclo-ligase [Ktedonobacteria bacterium brp13]|nr:phosphoribosylformylglycinamidine cyclo-ligase [Ktedonobacteria bacterium brp13]